MTYIKYSPVVSGIRGENQVRAAATWLYANSPLVALPSTPGLYLGVEYNGGNGNSEQLQKKGPTIGASDIPVSCNRPKVLPKSGGWSRLGKCAELLEMAFKGMQPLLNTRRDRIPLVPAFHQSQETIYIIHCEFGEVMNRTFGDVHSHVWLLQKRSNLEPVQEIKKMSDVSKMIDGTFGK